MINEIMTDCDIDFWEYHSDTNTKLLFDIYRNIKQKNTGDILFYRDNGYNICLKFQNDYLLTISSILIKLENIRNFFGWESGARYFTNNNYIYCIDKFDDVNYVLKVCHYYDTLKYPFLKRSEYIKEHNLENIENIVKRYIRN